MKKILLGTTALVAATAITSGVAMAETAISGGVYQQFGSAFDSDKNFSEGEGLGSYQTSSLLFTGGSTLENGMEMSYKIDFSTDNNDGTVDEVTLSLSDSWGTIKLGSDDTASDGMNGGTPAVSYITANSGTWSHLVNGTNLYDSTKPMFLATYSSFLGDTNGIYYYTPDMGGLKLGMSYNTGGTTNTAVAKKDVASIGASYSADMNGATVSAGAGVEHAMGLKAAANNGFGDDTANMYNASLGVSMGGVSVGVAYGSTDYSTASSATSTSKVDTETFAAGISYTTGAHTIGLDYVNGTSNNGAATSAETDGDIVAVGYAMDLGGGVGFDAGVAFIDVAGRNAGNSDDVDATVWGAGLGVSF